MRYRLIRSMAITCLIGLVWTAAAPRHGNAQQPEAGLPSFLSDGDLITGGLPNTSPETNEAQKQSEPDTPAGTAPPNVVTTPPQSDAINTTAPAPVKAIEDISKDLKALSDTIDKLETAIADQPRDDSFLAKTRPKIETVIEAATETLDTLGPRLSNIDVQIEKLGPQPKDGEPEEASQIKEERTRLVTAKTEIAGAKTKAELLIERARQLSGRTQDLRQRIFADAVLAHQRSPLSPSLWIDAVRELPAGGRHLASLLASWASVLAENWLGTFAVLILAIALFEALRRAMAGARTWALSKTQEKEPKPFFQRVLAATWVMASFALPGLAAAFVTFIGLESVGQMQPEVSRVAKAILLATFIVISVWAMARAILQPNRPNWRMFDIPNHAAQRLTAIFTWMATVYGTDLVLQHLMQVLFLPLPVRVIEAALITLASAALLLAFVRTPLTPLRPHGPAADLPGGEVKQVDVLGKMYGNTMAPRWLKWPAFLLAIAMTVAALTGYVALGRFVAGQVIVAGCLVVFGLLIWLAIRAFTDSTPTEQNSPLETFLRREMRLEQSQARLLTKTSSLLLQFALPFCAVPVLFLSWGYSLGDAIAWLKSLFFGFQVGQFRISLVQLLIAAGLFVGLLFLTRLVQRGLTARVMQPGRLDHGVAQSIHTGIGYLGFVIAVLVALSYAGFDITNLAIVAGALSIGIGFGLQSIVNNFVSGLIILFERPIKVGDWVVVNNFEGYVRKISVRSTEIETFDRTNVIVPNSEFISNPIINLTHRNALGRVVIPIGVSYQSDPVFVRELLLKVANDCPDILDNPTPSVAFEDFGASSLDFKVRAYIADVNKRLSTSSELRMRIFKALAEAGIEIPFPQQDIHLRDLDPIRTVLQRAALERAAGGIKPNDESSS